MTVVLEVRDLGKRFVRYRADRPRSFKEMLFRRTGPGAHAEMFWALRHVDFELARGRVLGIVGLNGAGKSTLLRLIGRVGRPDEGQISTRGRISGLLELGAGFHPDLSGRENVFVNGVIAGLTRAEVHARFDSIVAFSELEDSIDFPLHTYSQGMKQRLGFAIAMHTAPDLLLIDEMFAVGDQRFNQKCRERILEFRDAGCAAIIATHNTGAVKELCDTAIQLHRGQVVAIGAPEAVTDAYESDRPAVTVCDEASPDAAAASAS